MTRFSVIIPAHNASNTIASTLASCVVQSHPPHEIIVVDDCSSDGTASLVELFSVEHGPDTHPRIHLLRSVRNSGPSHARNIGWEAASGEFIAFLDADDTWHPQKLEVLNALIGRLPEVSIIGHGYNVLGSRMAPVHVDLDTLAQLTRMVSFGRLLLKNITATSCILVKTTVSARFDERARFTEDHELWLRIAHQHKIAFLDLKLTTLGREQLSAGGLSGNRLRMRQGELSMYCKVLKYEKRILFFMPFLFLFSLIKHIRKTIQLRFA